MEETVSNEKGYATLLSCQGILDGWKDGERPSFPLLTLPQISANTPQNNRKRISFQKEKQEKKTLIQLKILK